MASNSRSVSPCEMDNIHVFVFDLDGTLVKSEPEGKRRLGIAIRRCGLAFGQQEKERASLAWGLQMPDLVRAIVPAATADQVDKILSIFFAFPNHHLVPLYEGSRESVEHVRQLGKRAAILTGRESNTTMGIINHHKVDHLFDHIACRIVGKKPKPHPESVETLGAFLAGIGFGFEHCFMVGDHHDDCRTALDNGFGGLAMVRTGSLRYQVHPDIPEHCIINSIADLPAHIGKQRLAA